MMISPKNITRHELIGLKVKVKKSINNSYEKIVGKVVDETKNMLVIEQMGREKMVPKKDTIFEFEIEGRKIRIDGNLLIGRPEDRLKR